MQEAGEAAAGEAAASQSWMKSLHQRPEALAPAGALAGALEGKQHIMMSALLLRGCLMP